MADFAMPAALELEASRRNGIPAFRREVVHNTTTQNEYRPGELCYIPMDTGAAGAFMDVACTRLEFTVVIRNKNYFTDFISLPRCGWNVLIQEFAIELNNGLHELNRHYAECIELDMIKRGENRTPFEITRSNPWKPAGGTAGRLHINFIKPSMVTQMGLPHNVQYSPLSTITSATTPDSMSQSYLLWSQPFIREGCGRIGNNTLSSNSALIHGDNINLTSNTMEVAQTFWEDRLGRDPYQKVSHVAYIATGGDTEEGPVMIGADGSFNDTVIFTGGDTAFRNVESNARIYGQPYGAHLRSLARQSPASDYDISLYSLSYGQSMPSYSPGMWPAKQPTDLNLLQKEYEQNIRLINADNVFNYYANCKNIPVGIPVSLQGDETGKGTIWGSGLKTKFPISQYGYETEFQVSVKIYSSLIGLLADRWFPELVVPQGRMRVRLRFQEPNVAFQTLMDPCRRVPGTSRDFIPNYGLTGSYSADVTVTPADEERQDVLQLPTYQTVLTQTGLSGIGGTSAVEKLMAGIHPIMVADYEAGSVFVDAIALGKFPIPVLNLRSLQMPFLGGMGAHAGLPSNFPTKAISGMFEPMNQAMSTASSNVGTLATTLRGGTYEGGIGGTVMANKALWELYANAEFGCPPNMFYRTDVDDPIKAGKEATEKDIPPVSVAQYDYYRFPTDFNNRHVFGLNTGPVPLIQSTPAYIKGKLQNPYTNNPRNLYSTTEDSYQHNPCWNPFCYPIPQYLPMKDPWNKQDSRTIDVQDFVDEAEVCFGTFLESSVAQVRRSHSALFPLKVPDVVTSGLNERLTYIVRNIQIVTQQIVLPRGTALSIVENALDGGITMECRAWKEMETMLPQAESQKHLINMAAAFATDITFLFRPVSTYQGDRAYGYNSFSFYNPFTAFTFELEQGTTSDLVYNALGGEAIYYNECVISTRVPFDIQLQISSELLPRTPIDTINSLIRNVRWGDQVFSDRDYMELNPHLVPSYMTSKGMAINTLQDGFWACYLPIECLNDQSITDNPFFTSAELSLRKKLRGARATGGSLPFFKPLDGTFHLSFNFEAYMGQSDRIRTGIPIVNNNMFLKMEKCHLARTEQVQLLTVCNCDGKIVFERGGTMQFFT